jgi:ATP-dependent Clp protease ATP-binding subunit ClpC
MALELQRLFSQAKQAARRRGQKLSTAHLILAMFQYDRQAGVVMAQQGARERELLAALEHLDDEPSNAVELAVDRAEKAAAAAGHASPNAAHLLLAIAGESRSAGHRCLQSAGATPQAVREELLVALRLSAPSAADGRQPVKTTAYPKWPKEQHQERRGPGDARPERGPGAVAPLNKSAFQSKETPPVTGTRIPRTLAGTKKPPAPKRNCFKPASATAKPTEPCSVPPTAALFDLSTFPTLAAIGRNLTAAALAGEIDPVIGRDREIEQLLDILGRRRANNPVLVGPPGVGKTAIVEGLALYLARAGQKKNALAQRVMIELSVGSLVAGTGVRGALAEKLRALKSEVQAAQGRILLFIDEIHDLVGAGDGSDGAANELKSALARGELPCIGATTDNDFRRLFERDPALARRFTRVEVEEPSPAKALEIIQAIAVQYERHHGVAYHREALEAAVELSVRYLAGCQLPAKAIGIIDQAAARARRREKNVVDLQAVAEVVSEQCSVSAERLLMRDAERLLNLAKHLEERVIGQPEAISRVVPVLQKSLAGFRSRRPLATFLFLGPTGVGKTEMAKAIGDLLFPSSDLTRFDMSDFAQPHSVARLLGAPPGYIGYEDGGQLLEAVRTRPYQLILLDEIEKAHPEVLLALLPLLDEGRLKDSRGRTVDFTNTVVAMTSNLGAQRLESKSRIGFGADDAGSARQQLRDDAMAQARAALPPEFWNRIDEPLYFYPLCKIDVAAIARRFIEQIVDICAQRHHIEVTIDPSVFSALVVAGGFDQHLGARPMKRTVARLIEAPLAEAILSGQVKSGESLRLSGVGERILLSPSSGEPAKNGRDIGLGTGLF